MSSLCERLLPKYRDLPLWQAITEKGYDCKIIVLIVGSLGNVHCGFVTEWVEVLGITTSRAKRIKILFSERHARIKDHLETKM